MDANVDHHFHDQVFQIIDQNTVEQRTTTWHHGKSGGELTAAGADFVIDDVSQLMPVVREIAARIAAA